MISCGVPRMRFLPNALSLLRLPLAILLWNSSIVVRGVTILLAMLTDILDGFFARRYGWVSQSGTLIDPLMDRVFVLSALSIFLIENKLNTYEVVAMASRDIAICVFGVYLAFSGYWNRYRFQAMWCGKITTSLQFMVLFGVIGGWEIPAIVYTLFIVLGFLAFIELGLVLSTVLSKESPKLG